jgi:hypothetical protein
MTTRFVPHVLLALSLTTTACAVEDDDLTDGILEEEATAAEPFDSKADHLTIPFATFTDEIGSAGEAETRKVIKTLAAYATMFGHEPPAGTVDFATEWVVFYSAGIQSTGGYTASILQLSRSPSGKTLYVVTSLESPGPGCIVTLALSKPYVLAKLTRPTPKPKKAFYFADDVTYDCPTDTDPCAAVRCIAGTHCEAQIPPCLPGSPCPAPTAVCVPDVICGGFAGLPCPGEGTCVDDPTDSCDPSAGGADCSGMCVCLAMGACIPLHHWDNTPAVCGCVPDTLY